MLLRSSHIKLVAKKTRESCSTWKTNKHVVAEAFAYTSDDSGSWKHGMVYLLVCPESHSAFFQNEDWYLWRESVLYEATLLKIQDFAITETIRLLLNWSEQVNSMTFMWWGQWKQVWIPSPGQWLLTFLIMPCASIKWWQFIHQHILIRKKAAKRKRLGFWWKFKRSRALTLWNHSPKPSFINCTSEGKCITGSLLSLYEHWAKAGATFRSTRGRSALAVMVGCSSVEINSRISDALAVVPRTQQKYAWKQQR